MAASISTRFRSVAAGSTFLLPRRRADVPRDVRVVVDVRDLAEVAAAESAAVADDGETPDFMVQQQDDGVYYPLDDEGEY